VPVGPVAAPVMQWVMDGLPGALPVQPVLHPALDDGCWDGGPIAASVVVDALAGSAGWVLGITERTLVDEEGEPVYGQALVGGGSAVVSVACLRGADPLRLQHRVRVSAGHEGGHLAGLEHCADRGCAMHPSRCLSDTDGKRPALCDRCAEILAARGA